MLHLNDLLLFEVKLLCVAQTASCSALELQNILHRDLHYLLEVLQLDVYCKDVLIRMAVPLTAALF